MATLEVDETGLRADAITVVLREIMETARHQPRPPGD